MELNRAPANESSQNVSLSITSALVSAVLEWMLMFMIFVDASFSYLVTRFARYCQLQTPCLLCSRLDHVLGNEKDSFHWDLFCHNHKLNISSLVLCQHHNKLVDVHGTCETCFFSFATTNKSNAETYRLLVGKLGSEPYGNALAQGSSDSRKCMCCKEQWISKNCAEKLLKSKSIDPEETPMHGIIEGSSQIGQIRIKNADTLPHVEYKQVKVSSDTESEGPFSDTESVKALLREMEVLGQDSVANYTSSEPQIISVADFPALEKLIHPSPPIEFSHSETEYPIINSHHNLESETPLGHGLEELNWQQADHSNDVTEQSELVTIPEALPSPDTCDESKETICYSLDAKSTVELEKEVHVEYGEASHVGSDSAGTIECGETSMVVLVNEVQMDSRPNKTDNISQITESLDFGDAYKLALGTRSRQMSGRFLEQQRSMTESTKASEDLKLLLSQISAARGLELSSNDMSPRVFPNSEPTDAYGAMGMQIIQRRISLERNESNLSLDGSIIGEIEGETVLDRLKRQVEHDKRIMATLYKELEEERNASAIAVNQSMAMITRLQEEKAALHMEALQSIRMMEEQAEYDGEALQNANDLLTEKEKLIQDLEFELELLRNQLDDYSLLNNSTFVKPRLESDEDELKIAALGNLDNYKNDTVDVTDLASKISSGHEDEKQYILQCLQKLEEKLLMFAKHELYPDMIDGVEEVPEAEASASSQENGGTENTILQGDAVAHKDSSSSSKESSGKSRSSRHVCTDAELEAFRHELSVMNNRLESLEAEQNVIDCSINSLEKGSEGFEFIREITVRLRELHSALIKSRKANLT
ncbi:hypothetical protein ACP275_02G108900 [Erythranthe tilingii]